MRRCLEEFGKNFISPEVLGLASAAAIAPRCLKYEPKQERDGAAAVSLPRAAEERGSGGKEVAAEADCPAPSVLLMHEVVLDGPMPVAIEEGWRHRKKD